MDVCKFCNFLRFRETRNIQYIVSCVERYRSVSFSYERLRRREEVALYQSDDKGRALKKIIAGIGVASGNVSYSGT